ncbi:MAG: LysR family transcriptional regulator [Eubacterium sp.]|nr:LysR family transcriptional regulator [Eubacterium sp.]
MTITQIEYFMAVAEHKNISKAAEALFMTQPALSRQITAIEEELGIHLFFRKSRPITLTPAGEVLYRGLGGFTDKYYDIVRKAQIIGSGVGGALHFGVLPGIDIGDIFPKFFNNMKEKFPEIEISAAAGSFADLMNGLKTFEFDFVITNDFGVEVAENIETLLIDEQPNYLVMSKSHRMADKENVSLIDFKDEVFVVNAPDDLAHGGKVLEKCALAGFTPKSIVAENISQYLLMLETGMAVGVLNGRTTAHHDPNMVFVPIPDIDTNRILLVWDTDCKNPSLKNGIKGFKEVLKND